MGTLMFQGWSQVAFIVIGTWLFAHGLPKNDDFPVRVGVVLVVVAVITQVALSLGYSLFPKLTDDLSFLSASVSFGVVLALATIGVRIVWDAPWGTALFCSTSAYLMQSLAFGLDRILHVSGIVEVPLEVIISGGVAPIDVVSLLSCAVVVFLVVRLSMAYNLEPTSLLDVGNPAMSFAVGLSIVVSIIFDLAIKDVSSFEGFPRRYALVLSFTHVAVLTFILVAEYEVIYNHTLRENVTLMEHAMAERERQFELSRETITAVNRRVHDIRHHVAGILASSSDKGLDLVQLAQIVREVNIYDSAVRTGNAALDVVLTEKSLLCQGRGIKLSCIADGDAVAFLPSPDLYALFGNALDYAIEAVCQAEGDERRSISLNVREQMGMASISIEHYVPNDTQVMDGVLADGGLSYEGVRSIVERHEGTMSCTVAKDVLHLDVLLPLPE